MDDKELLSCIYQNADMGVDGILKVLESAHGGPIREALQSQLSEYDHIRSEAIDLLRQRGGEPASPSAMAKLSVTMSAMGNLLKENTPGHIAEMMIQGNAMGLTRITRRLNEYEGEDKAVRKLAGKLLAAEQQNNEEMKRFLT